MGEGMGDTETRAGEGLSRQVFGVGHACARLHVISVGHRLGQVSGDKLDGLQRQGVGLRVVTQGDVGLHCVGKGIHAGGGGKRGRHSDHEFRIIYGHICRDVDAPDNHFDVVFGVGDDRGGGYFAAGPGGGVDGYKERHRFGDGVHAFVIMDPAASRNHYADALAAVMGAAAAEGYDGVAAVFLVNLDPAFHILVGGVRLGARVDNRLQPSILDVFLDGVGDTYLRQALVGDDQGLFNPVGLHVLTDGFGGAAPYEGDGGHEKPYCS